MIGDRGFIGRVRDRDSVAHFGAIGGAAAIFSLLAGDWLAGVAVLVLAAVWHLLWTIAEPPVLALALTTQWLQVTSAIFYSAVSGRRIDVMDVTDYRPMVLIGLGCILVLVVGLRTGIVWFHRRGNRGVPPRGEAFSLSSIVPVYVTAFLVLRAVELIAFRNPALTQPILALVTLRYVLLFLVLRKLVYPTVRAGWLSLVILAEVAFGLTGYFAGFREPLFFAALAVLERFEARRRGHWLVMGSIVGCTIGVSLLWTGIKGDVRQRYDDLGESTYARAEVVARLASGWLTSEPEGFAQDADRLVDRMWSIPYPAQAVNDAMASDRPPLGGSILRAAIIHILTPRFLFPEKEELDSDSEMVREFSGEQVAGRESGTTIAFGYAAELFLDLGLPLMLVPVLLVGCMMGAAYAWLYRTMAHRDLAVATVSVILWLSLSRFESSLVMTLGTSVTLLIYAGGSMVLLDRYLLRRASVAP